MVEAQGIERFLLKRGIASTVSLKESGGFIIELSGNLAEKAKVILGGLAEPIKYELVIHVPAPSSPPPKKKSWIKRILHLR